MTIEDGRGEKAPNPSRQSSIARKGPTFNGPTTIEDGDNKEMKKMNEQWKNFTIVDGEKMEQEREQFVELVEKSNKSDRRSGILASNVVGEFTEGGEKVEQTKFENENEENDEVGLKAIEDETTLVESVGEAELFIEDEGTYNEPYTFSESELEVGELISTEELCGLYPEGVNQYRLHFPILSEDEAHLEDYYPTIEDCVEAILSSVHCDSDEVCLQVVQSEIGIVAEYYFIYDELGNHGWELDNEVETIEDEDSPKVAFYLSIIEMTSGQPLRLNYVSFNGIEGVMRAVESMTFNINHQDSVQTVVIPNSVGLAYSPTELRIVADEIIIEDDGRGVLDGLHIFNYVEDGWEISYEAPCSIEDDSIEDDDDFDFEDFTDSILNEIEDELDELVDEAFKELEDDEDSIEDEDENFMEVFGFTEESIGDWAKDYVFSHLDNSESHIEDVKKAVGEDEFNRFFLNLGLSETDGGRDLAIFVENNLTTDSDGEDIEDDLTIKWNIIQQILNEVASETFNDTVTQTTEGRSENKGGEDEMNPENVLPTGDGLTEIGTVTGGETDNNLTEKQIVDLVSSQLPTKETWIITEGDFISEVLYLQEAYGFNLVDFLNSSVFTEGEMVHCYEVEEFLYGFHQIEDLHPKDDIDFDSEARKHHQEAIASWQDLLEFAIFGDVEESHCDSCGQSKNEDHCDGNLYEVSHSMLVCSECYHEATVICPKCNRGIKSSEMTWTVGSEEWCSDCYGNTKKSKKDFLFIALQDKWPLSLLETAFPLGDYAFRKGESRDSLGVWRTLTFDSDNPDSPAYNLRLNSVEEAIDFIEEYVSEAEKPISYAILEATRLRREERELGWLDERFGVANRKDLCGFRGFLNYLGIYWNRVSDSDWLMNQLFDWLVGWNESDWTIGGSTIHRWVDEIEAIENGICPAGWVIFNEMAQLRWIGESLDIQDYPDFGELFDKIQPEVEECIEDFDNGNY